MIGQRDRCSAGFYCLLKDASTVKLSSRSALPREYGSTACGDFSALDKDDREELA